MYEYVNDKQFLSRMRSLCGDIMQDFCHTLKEEYDIGASFYLVGSGARNLIMQNANRPIDLDYNLEITRIDDWKDCRNIKENVRKAFNMVLREHGWNDCEDSTSSLTTEKRHFTHGTLTEKCDYEIIAAFKTEVYTDSPESFKYYQFINADTGDEFNAYITKCKELALYDTGVTAEYGDKLITLSTCEYSRNNGRMVVVAKKIAE